MNLYYPGMEFEFPEEKDCFTLKVKLEDCTKTPQDKTNSHIPNNALTPREKKCQ